MFVSKAKNEYISCSKIFILTLALRAMNVLWLDFLLLSDYKHHVFTYTNMTISNVNCNFLCSKANICIQLFRSYIHLYSIFNIQDDESLASLRKDHQYVACHLSFNVVWCFKHMLQIIYNYVWQQISAIIYNIWSLNKVNEQKIDNQLRKNEILWWVVSPQ